MEFSDKQFNEWSRLAGLTFSKEQKKQMMDDLARIRSMNTEMDKTPPSGTPPLIYMSEQGHLNEDFLDPVTINKEHSHLKKTPKGRYFTSKK